jgi:DNA-binding Lrp family transcriptional regulator
VYSFQEQWLGLILDVLLNLYVTILENKVANSKVCSFDNILWSSHHCIIFLYLIHMLLVMPKAFVLMNAELGSEDSIVSELKSIDGVKEIYQVYGVYDIVAQVESETMEKVKETITWKLRKLNGVKSTLTMIVME